VRFRLRGEFLSQKRKPHCGALQVPAVDSPNFRPARPPRLVGGAGASNRYNLDYHHRATSKSTTALALALAWLSALWLWLLALGESWNLLVVGVGACAWWLWRLDYLGCSQFTESQNGRVSPPYR
jgi:hypothetical protein